MEKRLIIVRGGGDLATGTVHKLWSSGFPVLVLETANPAAIRRQVSICEAVYDGEAVVEGMRAVRIRDAGEAGAVIAVGDVPVLVDPKGEAIERLKPAAVVDAIIAKRNLGTHRGMAPLTVALGPGFTAGEDVDVVIETKRGHNLGRVIREGAAAPNSGIPGMIGGYAAERVIHAAEAGIFRNVRKIGDIVEAGEEIGRIELGTDGEAVRIEPENGGEIARGKSKTDREIVQGKSETNDYIPVTATIPGIIRGLLRDGYPVTKGFKIADIDPRLGELANCFTISDKARCIAGGVLEAVVAAAR